MADDLRTDVGETPSKLSPALPARPQEVPLPRSQSWLFRPEGQSVRQQEQDPRRMDVRFQPEYL